MGAVLRILSAVPLENTVTVQSLAIEPSQWIDMRLSLPLQGHGGSSNRPGNWLVFPGLTVPARMLASQQTGRTVKVKTSQTVTVPLAQPVYRLVALDLRHDQTTVSGDFFDGSGRQPLFRHVEELSFRLNESATVLSVRVKFINVQVREKRWRTDR